MPRGAGLIVLLALIAPFIVSRNDSQDYLRVTSKTEVPGCHQLTLTDLDRPEKGPITTCVDADRYDYYEVGARYMQKP